MARIHLGRGNETRPTNTQPNLSTNSVLVVSDARSAVNTRRGIKDRRFSISSTHNSGQSGCNGAALIRAKQLFQAYAGIIRGLLVSPLLRTRVPQKFFEKKEEKKKKRKTSSLLEKFDDGAIIGREARCVQLD